MLRIVSLAWHVVSTTTANIILMNKELNCLGDARSYVEMFLRIKSQRRGKLPNVKLQLYPNPNPNGLFGIAALMLDYNDNRPGAVDITAKSHYSYYQLTTHNSSDKITNIYTKTDKQAFKTIENTL